MPEQMFMYEYGLQKPKNVVTNDLKRFTSGTPIRCYRARIIIEIDTGTTGKRMMMETPVWRVEQTLSTAVPFWLQLRPVMTEFLGGMLLLIMGLGTATYALAAVQPLLMLVSGVGLSIAGLTVALGSVYLQRTISKL